MAYKLRVILDVEEDVFRDIAIDESIDMEALHYRIAKIFGFKGKKMASFYKSNTEWEQGEEIPLMDMSEDATSLTMAACKTRDIINTEGDKLIYVYDFFKMWTFYVELLDADFKTDKELPYVLLSFGNVPDEAPEKEFIAEDNFDDSDIFGSEEGFENIDDFDFDNY